MFFDEIAYAMGSSGQTGGDSAFGSPLSMNILLMVVIFAIFYFLIIRPQHREAKRVKGMLAALKKGDRVITVGGVYGVILDVRGDVVTLDLGDSTIEIGLKYIANIAEGRPAASSSSGKNTPKRRPTRKYPAKAVAKQDEDEEIIDAELKKNHEEPADDKNDDTKEEKK